MANISLKAVDRLMKDDFKVHGTGTDSFENTELSSINMAIGRINRQCNLATRISAVSKIDGTIALDQDYFDVFVTLVSLNLRGFGRRPAKGKETKYTTDRALIDDMIDDIRQDILNQIQDANTDDDVDVAQLGGLG